MFDNAAASRLSPRAQLFPKNRLLRSLPEADLSRLLPDLETVPAPKGLVFQHKGDPIEYVYFPNGGVVSITSSLADGSMVEAATVGVEGMVGLEAYFCKNARAAGDTMVQIPDTSTEKLSVVAFRRELARQGPLLDVLGRYAQTMVAHMMQSIACMARHEVQHRCCRWLLMTHDRVGQDKYPLSHEFLATMLGVRRQSVTIVAGTLQAAGLIRYKHGQLTILDRAGLEEVSCECYAAMRIDKSTG